MDSTQEGSTRLCEGEKKPHSHGSIRIVFFFFNFKILHLKTQYDRKHLYTPAVFLVWYSIYYIHFFLQKILLCQTETNSPRPKNQTKTKKQLRHNFVVFLLNEKTEKVQKWVGSAIVFENHSTTRKSICVIGTLITGQFWIVQYLLKYSFK